MSTFPETCLSGLLLEDIAQDSLVYPFAIYAQGGLNLFRKHDCLVLAKGEIFLHKMFTLDHLQANLHGTR